MATEFSNEIRNCVSVNDRYKMSETEKKLMHELKGGQNEIKLF